MLFTCFWFSIRSVPVSLSPRGGVGGGMWYPTFPYYICLLIVLVPILPGSPFFLFSVVGKNILCPSGPSVWRPADPWSPVCTGAGFWRWVVGPTGARPAYGLRVKLEPRPDVPAAGGASARLLGKLFLKLQSEELPM